MEAKRLCEITAEAIRQTSALVETAHELDADAAAARRALYLAARRSRREDEQAMCQRAQ
jgi:hypothetical protein